MRSIPFLFILLSAVSVSWARHSSVNEKALLFAIGYVESRCNPRAIGSMGERGIYQFRFATWKQHTEQPFSLAHTGFSHEVALRHIRWIQSRLRANGMPVDVWHIAAAWNCGVSAVVSRNVPSSTRKYAWRVSVKYEKVLRNELVDSNS